MDKMRCSVVMASYNGEKYIRQQLESIISNLTNDDEILISDDGSSDKTRNIIQEYQDKWQNIRLIDGPGQGVIANFESAIKCVKGRYIFLCDQDDIWELNKIDSVLTCFKDTGCSVVIHNADVWNEKKEVIIPSYFQYRRSGPGVLKNIIKNSYIGCCMAFRRELLHLILPFPRNIEMHDQWIGIIGNIQGKCCFLNDILIHYRRHEDNVSAMHHYPLKKMIRNRSVFCLELLKRMTAKR